MRHELDHVQHERTSELVTAHSGDEHVRSQNTIVAGEIQLKNAVRSQILGSKKVRDFPSDDEIATYQELFDNYWFLDDKTDYFRKQASFIGDFLNKVYPCLHETLQDPLKKGWALINKAENDMALHKFLGANNDLLQFIREGSDVTFLKQYIDNCKANADAAEVSWYQALESILAPALEPHVVLEPTKLALQVTVGAGGAFRHLLIAKNFAEEIYKDAEVIVVLSFDAETEGFPSFFGDMTTVEDQLKTQWQNICQNSETPMDGVTTMSSPISKHNHHFRKIQLNTDTKTIHVLLVKDDFKIHVQGAIKLLDRLAGIENAFVCGIRWDACIELFWKQQYAVNFNYYVFMHGPDNTPTLIEKVLDVKFIKSQGYEAKLKALLQKEPGANDGEKPSTCFGWALSESWGDCKQKLEGLTQ